MAPFLANQSSGADSYKWMLYGDDDTVFYLDNVLRMLEALELDPAMPYFITDHIWFLRSLDEGGPGTQPFTLDVIVTHRECKPALMSCVVEERHTGPCHCTYDTCPVSAHQGAMQCSRCW